MRGFLIGALVTIFVYATFSIMHHDVEGAFDFLHLEKCVKYKETNQMYVQLSQALSRYSMLSLMLLAMLIIMLKSINDIF